MNLTIVSNRCNKLSGEVYIVGDKSISHRLVMFSAIANGNSIVKNLLKSADVNCTINAMEQMGAEFTWQGNDLHVKGVGLDGLKTPANALNMGNSGTSARLLSGIVASNDISATFVGDSSLSKRPMERVITPLSLMGAKFTATNNNFLPMNIQGSSSLNGIKYVLPVASAQIKSSILLAGLRAKGETIVIEPEKTRDHTERLLKFLGVNITEDNNIIKIQPSKGWQGADFFAVGDISSAMFLIVAATLVDGSNIKINNVGLNKTRIGALDILNKMGANISIENMRMIQGEEVGSIVVKSAKLTSVIVDKNVPTFIDEIPILAVAACFANGISEFYNLSELKVKESNRLESVFNIIKSIGGNVKMGDDSLIIDGMSSIKGGVEIDSKGDHRLAMAFSIMGMLTSEPIIIKNAQEIQTSFPNYLSVIESLGGNIKEVLP